MNPITSSLVAVLVLAGVAIGHRPAQGRSLILPL